MSSLTNQIHETMARIGHLEAAKKHYDLYQKKKLN